MGCEAHWFARSQPAANDAAHKPEQQSSYSPQRGVACGARRILTPLLHVGVVVSTVLGILRALFRGGVRVGRQRPLERSGGGRGPIWAAGQAAMPAAEVAAGA